MKTTLHKQNDLTKRLSIYTASTGALMALGFQASGQVIYSGPQNLEMGVPNQFLELDLNGDMIPDFGIVMYGTEASGDYGPYHIELVQHIGAMLNMKTDSYKNSWMTHLIDVATYTSYGITYTYRVPIAKGLEAGELITPEFNDWVNETYPSVSGLLGIYQNYVVEMGGTTIYSVNISIGDFLKEEKFTGIRFHVGNEAHYGWIRIMVDSTADSLMIFDWAYQETPDVAIQAGEGLGINLPPVFVIAGASPFTADSITHLTLTATEETTGLDVSDLIITNGTASNWAEVTAGLEYTVDITAVAEGRVEVMVPAGVCADLDALDNVEASVAWNYDLSGPEVAFFTDAPSSHNLYAFTIIMQCDEPTLTPDIEDFTVVNCSISNLISHDGGTAYELNILSQDEGPASIELPAGVLLNEAGFANEESVLYSWEFDITAPVITMEAQVTDDYTEQAEVTVSIYFSEEVTGFSTGDINLTNASLVSLTRISDTERELVVEAVASGEVEVEIPIGSVNDLAGNFNTTVEVSWTYEDPMALNIHAQDGSRIFPNPVTDELQVDLKRNADLVLVDMQGKVVWQENNMQKGSINLSGLQKGMYIMYVTDEKGVKQHKIVKE